MAYQQSHALCELWTVDRTIASSVLWSFEPTNTAIVFIHGFNGDAIGTWEDFDSLLPASPELTGHDIFFYGYDGLMTYASESGDQFHSFLDQLFTMPDEIFRFSLPPAMARPPDFGYDNVLIVAHSLGAVVTRFALLTAHNAENDWLAKVSAIFFAPAHAGTRTVDWVVSAITGLDFVGANLLVALARGRYRVADDLREDSKCLSDLRDEIAAIAMPHRRRLLAKKVVWARNDRVVINKSFLQDPKPETILNTTHTAVCKPRRRFNRPLRIILENL